MVRDMVNDAKDAIRALRSRLEKADVREEWRVMAARSLENCDRLLNYNDCLLDCSDLESSCADGEEKRLFVLIYCLQENIELLCRVRFQAACLHAEFVRLREDAR